MSGGGAAADRLLLVSSRAILRPVRSVLCRLLHGPFRPVEGPEGACLLESLRALLRLPPERLPSPPPLLDWDDCFELALSHAIVGLVGSLWNARPEKVGPPGRVRRAIDDRVL